MRYLRNLVLCAKIISVESALKGKSPDDVEAKGKVDDRAAYRDARGRYLPGAPPGPGRKSLPPWFSAKGEDALKVLVQVAAGEIVDEKISRLQACIEIIDRVYGKATVVAETKMNGTNVLLAAVATELAMHAAVAATSPAPDPSSSAPDVDLHVTSTRIAGDNDNGEP